ncbi:uncharacterized protein LOC126981666 isoform X2 [Eriocheir sinensis]|uniref:uncharacterized protein LOC126981666 isoform X2 n=1 Tax=Eriocheir sinensis TaxID=95602 RepID=UPI0021C60C58|nr:uncharacterized protein LOC126981666 isoform X2 [Eriocheir sinensis]
MEGQPQVFREAWMNRCYESLVYPNPSCVQEPPLNPRQKERYVEDAKLFLDDCLKHAMKDCGYPEDVSGYHRGETLLGRFLGEVRGAYREGLNQQLAVRMFEEETEKRQQLQKRKKRTQDKHKRYRNSNDEEEEDQEEEEEEEPHADIGLPDVAGEAMVAVMVHDKRRKEGVVKRLRQKYLPLPNSLRRYLWWGVLEGREEGVEGEEEAKGRFKKRLEKEMKKQKVKRAIESKEWKSIDNSVIEVYENTPVLTHLDTDRHLLQTARAINLLAVHDRSYSSAAVFFLLPLLLLLNHHREEEDDEDEEEDGEDYNEAEVMRVGVWGELLTRHCLLGAAEVFGVAAAVVAALGPDEAYLAHLNTCLEPAQVEKLNVKLFPPEVLLRDGKASAKLYGQLTEGGRGGGSRSLPSAAREVFGALELFIRKWLVQAFVGVVSVRASLWVWDMLFLDGWRQETLRQVCVALLALIRPWAMLATDYEQVTKVLLEGPGRVYLSDLRRALAHLEGGGAFTDTPHTAAHLGGRGGRAHPPPSIKIEDADN